jgi:hypothetical protein
MRGLRRIGACCHLRLLDKVPPAGVMVGGALRILELFQNRFSFSLAPNDRDDSSRPVSSDIVEDNRVRMIGFVESQKVSKGNRVKSRSLISRILDFHIFCRRINRSAVWNLIRGRGYCYVTLCRKKLIAKK